MNDVKEERQIILPILVLVAFSIQHANAELLSGLRDAFVVVGDSINFTCSSNISADIHWERNDEVVYAGGSVKKPFAERFQMDKNDTTLRLLNATLEDAAELHCIENQLDTGQKRSANLTVLASYPQCQSNMKLDGFVGPNACGIRQDVMIFTCAISFNGKNPPLLMWRSSANTSLPIEKSVCENKTNRINCSLTVMPTKEFHGSSITCLMAASNEMQYNCSIEDIKVNYFLAPDSKPAEVKVKEEISCLADSNQALRFTWTVSHDNETKVVGNNRSHVIQSPGQHWCNVSYTIGDVACFSVGPIVYARSDEIEQCNRSHITQSPEQYRCNVSYTAKGVACFECFSVEPNVHAKSEQCTTGQPIWIPWLFFGFLLLILLILSGVLVFFYIRKRKKKKRETIRLSEQEESKLLQNSETIADQGPACTETKASREHDCPIYGLAILDDELFTISKGCKEFEVYEYTGGRVGELKRCCPVDHLKDPRNIVACRTNDCLYIENMIEENRLNEIIRVNKENGTVLRRWEIDKDLGRISITKESNVLVTVRSNNSLREYTPEGDLLHEISFGQQDNINNLRHALLLDTGHYVLCHGDGKDVVKRVCIVDKSGKVLAKFGDETADPENKTADTEMKLTNPQYLATDPDGSILVVDDRRIVLLNRQLHFKRVLLKDDEHLMDTFRVCLDIERIRLLVADNAYNRMSNAKGRVFVYSVPS